jgi:protein-disulfide isomerase
MKTRRFRVGVFTALIGAALLSACGGGGESKPQATTSQSVEQVEAADQPTQSEPEARVQVIRDRAYLGSPDAPVVIEEYSDFL